MLAGYNVQSRVWHGSPVLDERFGGPSNRMIRLPLLP